MKSRKRNEKAMVKAAEYASTAAATTSTAMEVVGFFVAIPGFIKWAVVAFVSLIAGCIGCCSGRKAAQEEDEKEVADELKRSVSLKEREQLISMTAEIKHELDEMKEEIALHHPETEEMKKLKKVKPAIDLWVAKSRERKKEKETKPSTTGIFSTSLKEMPEPITFQLKHAA